MITLKSNAPTVMKNTFFQKANYLEPTSYEEHFDNDICRRENNEIKRLIDINIDKDITITDVGCGTGLGRTLLPTHSYVGIDMVEKSINHCIMNYCGDFRVGNAEEYIDQVESINPIFLFSLNYLNVNTIHEYLKKTDKTFFAVHYNKPYLSPTSVYQSKFELFSTLHPYEKRESLYQIFKLYGAETFKLLDEDYYYVTIIQK